MPTLSNVWTKMFSIRKKYTYVGPGHDYPKPPFGNNVRVDLEHSYAFGYECCHAFNMLKAISKAGYDACIAGGCVRDMVMGKSFHDVDIATNMPPEMLKKVFGEIKSNNGEAHGTVLVPFEGFMYEVTRFRADGTYSDGRHPDFVEWAETFEEDSRRRDFTINAMGIDCEGNVLDYHGGIDDLFNKIIRTVGNPEDRFNEDPLRIVRAFRFASVMGFEIDNDTLAAASKVSPKLVNIHAERIHDELSKVIYAPTEGKGFARFVKWIAEYVDESVIKKFFGMTARNLLTVSNNIQAGIEQKEGSWNTYIAYMMLFHNLDNFKAVMTDLKCTRDEIGYVQFYRHMIDFRESHPNIQENIVEWVDLVSDKHSLDATICYQMLHEGSPPVALPMYDFLSEADNPTHYNTRKCSEFLTTLGKYSGKEYGVALHKIRKAMYLHKLTSVYEFSDFDAKAILDS